MNMDEIRYLHNMRSPSIYRTTLAFNRFRINFPENMLENSIGYVFFTKPDLNIFARYSNAGTLNKDFSSRVEFNDLLKTDPELFRNLQVNQGNGPFIYPLTNAVKNFTTKDEIIKTRDSVETANDWKVVYGHRINDSRASDTVDLTFQDDRNLTVYKTLKIWVNYISLVTLGEISPHSENRRKRILDYAGSIYYFLTDETGTNILYWCKLIGTFPLNIPSSTMGWDLGSFKQLEYNVSFQYSMKDESPLVIADFNKICDANTSTHIPTVTEKGIAPTTWAQSVFIETVNNKYKLRFN